MKCIFVFCALTLVLNACNGTPKKHNTTVSIPENSEFSVSRENMTLSFPTVNPGGEYAIYTPTLCVENPAGVDAKNIVLTHFRAISTVDSIIHELLSVTEKSSTSDGSVEICFSVYVADDERKSLFPSAFKLSAKFVESSTKRAFEMSGETVFNRSDMELSKKPKNANEPLLGEEPSGPPVTITPVFKGDFWTQSNCLINDDENPSVFKIGLVERQKGIYAYKVEMKTFELLDINCKGKFVSMSSFESFTFRASEIPFMETFANLTSNSFQPTSDSLTALLNQYKVCSLLIEWKTSVVTDTTLCSESVRYPLGKGGINGDSDALFYFDIQAFPLPVVTIGEVDPLLDIQEVLFNNEKVTFTKITLP
ncbi:MAG: hypothetical protein EOP04_07540 [Proteobacteria bacterium]|nr:MAG: hypothetical protein EOP04_07540 [Pseudomonadota bacterium]